MPIVDDREEARAADTGAEKTKRLRPRTRQILEDLDAVLNRADPLGPEGWQAVRDHANRHGVHIRSSD